MDLGLVPFRGDPFLYVKTNEEDLDVLSGMYVDVWYLTWNEPMVRCSEMTLRKFDSKPRIWDSFTFFRTNIVTKHDFSFDITQRTYFLTLLPWRFFRHNPITYVDKLRRVRMDASFEFLSSYITVLGWIECARPDPLVDINKAAQVKVNTFNVDKMKHLNKTMQCQKSTQKFIFVWTINHCRRVLFIKRCTPMHLMLVMTTCHH